jgi:hypothetical protein
MTAGRENPREGMLREEGWTVWKIWGSEAIDKAAPGEGSGESCPEASTGIATEEEKKGRNSRTRVTPYTRRGIWQS